DYTILNTTGPNLSYHPEKLSMERTVGAAFGPEDRIGQLTMRNLDIADSRARLEQYAAMGLVGVSTADVVGQLEAGGAAQIADAVTGIDEEADELGLSAAFDAGTD
ncbi:MAG: argininosuccinate synthase, partial [Actinobacteria bacterium]|nr:argininosuccinate synthase [Actinomycetota bacterium]